VTDILSSVKLSSHPDFFTKDEETKYIFKQINEVSLDNFLKPEVLKMVETELKELSANDSNWSFEVNRLSGHFQVADLGSKDFQTSAEFCLHDENWKEKKFPFDEKYHRVKR